MSIFKYILSYTQEISDNKCHNVITVFGLKFKYKNLKQNKIFVEQNEINVKEKIKSLRSAINLKDKEQYKKTSILFKYGYQNSMANHGVNLGDYVQTLATQNILKNLLPNIEYKFWDRDELAKYDDTPAFVIMQGWFAYGVNYLPNEKLLPVFIGTHITTSKRDEFCLMLKENPDYFKNMNFGCRDTSTLKFMRENGLSSYLSRCLTLTFPRRDANIEYNKIFIVDIPEKFLKYIPKEILNNAEIVSQKIVDSNKNISEFNNYEKYIAQTKDILSKYRDTAGLVITSALHCASPCIAMGIPVILIDFEKKNDRFGSLDGIIKIYNKQDLISGNIDFNPIPPDIEDLKQLMTKNVELSIKETFEEEIDKEELNKIRKKISKYRK